MTELKSNQAYKVKPFGQRKNSLDIWQQHQSTAKNITGDALDESIDLNDTVTSKVEIWPEDDEPFKEID